MNKTLYLNLQTATSSLLVTAIHNVFIVAVIMNIIGFVLCFFLKDLHMSNEMEEEIGYEDAPGEIDLNPDDGLLFKSALIFHFICY